MGEGVAGDRYHHIRLKQFCCHSLRRLCPMAAYSRICRESHITILMVIRGDLADDFGQHGPLHHIG